MSLPTTGTQAVPSRVTADVAPAPVPIESVVRQISEVSTLPHVALRVMEVARDPEAGAGDLRAIIEGDPALSARVLRCVNSAAYSLRTTVTCLQQAISYLGFNQIRNLAITASVSQVFKANEATSTYRRSELWRHMVSVGVCARMAATRQRLPNFEEAFLAGLLHDIGIVLADQHCNPQFVAMMLHLGDGEPLVDTEQEYLGFDHTVLGGRISEAWCFPPAVRASIRFHHMSHNYRGSDAAIVRSVEIANWLCTMKGITSVGRPLVRLPVEAMQAAGLDKEDLKVLAEDLDHEISLNRRLFDL